MTYRIRFTPEAEDDLLRLYRFMLEQDATDWTLAEQALAAIRAALVIMEQFPFTCRKAWIDRSIHSPFLRELLIPFGDSGYVALFEIEDAEMVTILAVRHQRESDYH
ncbi:MAG: type II toxin-antitoxin system RelE/ParE family toxin [Chromatiaceae bacterium]|nr:type II toxin-antitoxin system RelE/ParE family toxin [Chromatiaceae bacterium]